MKAKYVLLALLVACSYESVWSHIVTTSHVDLPLLYCVKSINNMLRFFCPTYGRYSSEFTDGVPLLPRDVATAREATWERIVRTCCAKPCSVPELMTIC